MNNNSYLLIEDMKLEVMSNSYSLLKRRTLKFTDPKYKLKVAVTFDQYDQIKKLKGKDISFIYKKNVDEFFMGRLNIFHLLGTSSFKWGNIIHINFSLLKIEKAPKNLSRDLLLNELLG